MGVPAGAQKKTLPRITLLALVSLVSLGAHGGRGVRLGGHYPAKSIAQARHLGRLDPKELVRLAVVLHPHDEAGQDDYARRVSDPADPLFRHFLTREQYKARFAPTAAELRQVTDYLTAKGLTVTKLSGQNLVVYAAAPAAAIESAFQVELHEYIARDGRRVRAPSDDPLVDAELAARIQGVHGLSSFRYRKKHLAMPHGQPRIDAGLAPSGIQTAYGFSTSASAGSGETIALYELDGYTLSDIQGYASTYSITLPTINNTLLDGATGAAGENASEVTLDIEMLLAVSPAATIDVVMAPNTDAGSIDILDSISANASVNEVSISWGLAEDEQDSSYMSSEKNLFSAMATAGQSVFVAAGDSGAYADLDESTTLHVQDPASQVFVTAVGGTELSVVSGTGAYSSETSWNESSSGEGAGAGGISGVWGMSQAASNWQLGLASALNLASSTMRNVPDVSLNADPYTGYRIYYGGTWAEYGGTSAAAPLWAAYAAQINQARVTALEPRLGSANAALYAIGQSSLYGSTFHDIHDGSTNMYFPAVSGYDLSTGLGTPVGASLQAALVASLLPPLAPTGVTAAGSGPNSVVLQWTASANAASYTIYKAASLGGIYSSIASGVAVTTYTDAAAGGAVNYYYVAAVNSAGNSGPSMVHAGGVSLAAPSGVSGLSVTGAP